MKNSKIEKEHGKIQDHSNFLISTHRVKNKIYSIKIQNNQICVFLALGLKWSDLLHIFPWKFLFTWIAINLFVTDLILYFFQIFPLIFSPFSTLFSSFFELLAYFLKFPFYHADFSIF